MINVLEQNKTVELDFTPEEQARLFALIDIIRNPHSFLEWYNLSTDQQELLIRRYGKPRKAQIQINLVGYTKGEGCADNERAYPENAHSKNYVVSDNCVLIYSLYGNRPNIKSDSKLRLVSAGLVVAENGQILLPDFFYTPTSTEVRQLVINQMNNNSVNNNSISYATLWEQMAIDQRAIDVTIYRGVGSRLSYMDMMNHLFLGREGMATHGVGAYQIESDIKASLLVKRHVETETDQIVRTANAAEIEDQIAAGNTMKTTALELFEKIKRSRFKSHLAITDINLQEKMIDLAFLAELHAEIIQVNIPSKKYPLFKITWYEDGQKKDLYCYSKDLADLVAQ